MRSLLFIFLMVFTQNAFSHSSSFLSVDCIGNGEVTRIRIDVNMRSGIGILCITENDSEGCSFATTTRNAHVNKQVVVTNGRIEFNLDRETLELSARGFDLNFQCI